MVWVLKTLGTPDGTPPLVPLNLLPRIFLRFPLEISNNAIEISMKLNTLDVSAQPQALADII